MPFTVDVHIKATASSKASRVGTLMEDISALFRRVVALEGCAPPVPYITTKEEYPVTPRDDDAVRRVKASLSSLGVRGASLLWVPSDYYQHTLTWRRDVLKAPSISHLCKSMLVENTSFSETVLNDPSRHNNERFYIVVYQYVDRFDSDKLMRYFREANPGVGKKSFNYRVSDQGERVTGFTAGGFTVFGMAQPITVVLSAKLLALRPLSLVLGGGHVDLKLILPTEEFVRVLAPIVADVTNPLTEEELAEKA